MRRPCPTRGCPAIKIKGAVKGRSVYCPDICMEKTGESSVMLAGNPTQIRTLYIPNKRLQFCRCSNLPVCTSLTLLVPPNNTFIIHTKNKKYIFDKVENILFQMKPKLFTIHYNCV
jgi:hypothetical protein